MCKCIFKYIHDKRSLQFTLNQPCGNHRTAQTADSWPDFQICQISICLTAKSLMDWLDSYPRSLSCDYWVSKGIKTIDSLKFIYWKVVFFAHWRENCFFHDCVLLGYIIFCANWKWDCFDSGLSCWRLYSSFCGLWFSTIRPTANSVTTTATGAGRSSTHNKKVSILTNPLAII